MPQLSIITINKNDAEGLKRTLESIWDKQVFKDFEHIIIDGASTDRSVDVIKEYESKLAYWISEPDNGIYNAMNKGIVKAQGDYLLFLNSGDWLEDDILSQVFKEGLTEDIVYADFYWYYNEDKIVPELYPDELTVPFMLTHSLGHPSSFIKRVLFKDMLYEEKYRIISDWVFFVRKILLCNCSTRHLNLVTSYFNMYGISTDPNSRDLVLREQADFFEYGFPQSICDLSRTICNLSRELENYEKALDILSKHRVIQLVESTWVQRKARQCIKLLFKLEKILGKNKH